MAEIKYIDDTFAHKTNGVIYLNTDLPKYPKLHQAVLDHELAHELHDNFTLKDFWLDLTATLPKDEFNSWKIDHKDVVRRMMLPINKFGVNVNVALMYIMIITSVVFIVWISKSLI